MKGLSWPGEEALAIAVYCALKHRSGFRNAIIASVNHSGDSDSTGAIKGNILGAYLGLNSIPKEWVEKLELKGVIMQATDDLLIGYQDDGPGRSVIPLGEDFKAMQKHSKGMQIKRAGL